jgi:hypothetical protein
MASSAIVSSATISFASARRFSGSHPAALSIFSAISVARFRHPRALHGET